jgi:hypothetical protein
MTNTDQKAREMDAEELCKRLRQQAQRESEVSRMMAEDKSLRQSDNPERRTDLYMWAKPEQTASWQAADMIEVLSRPTPTPERDVPCPTCEGKGVYDSYDGDGRAFEFECYICNGTGRSAIAAIPDRFDARETLKLLEAEYEAVGLSPPKPDSFDGGPVRAALRAITTAHRAGIAAATVTKNVTVGEVTQADRDAAAELGRAIRHLTRSEASAIKAGQVDTIAYVQAFSRHRQAGIDEGLERAARVADERERLLTELNERQPRAEHRQRAAEASLIAYKLRSMIPGEGD